MQKYRMDKENLTETIYEHCLGSGDPTSDLVSKGVITEEWVSKYLQLLEHASENWGHEVMVPRKVVAGVHYASFYLNIRYEVWSSRAGAVNRETEYLLGSLRTRSEIFILNVQNV